MLDLSGSMESTATSRAYTQTTDAGRKAATLIKKVKENHEKAKKYLKLTSKAGSKDAWAAHQSRIASALKSKFPDYTSAVAKADFKNFDSSSTSTRRSRNKSNDGEEDEDLKLKQVAVADVDYEGGDSNSKSGDKGPGSFSMNFGDDDDSFNSGSLDSASKESLFAELLASNTSCSQAQQAADPDWCAKLDAAIAGKRAMAALKKNRITRL